MRVRLLQEAQVMHPDLEVLNAHGIRDEAATVARIADVMRQYKRREITSQEYRDKLRITVPVGTEIDRADAWKLVDLGMAEPVDDEARAACPDASAKMESRRQARERLEDAAATGDPAFDAPKKRRRSRAANRG